MSNDLQRRVFGDEGTVYPGHCVSLAYLIMLAYPSLDAAKERKEGASFPDALSNGDIPGAGGPVYSGLRVLELAFSQGIDAALAYGDKIWEQETQSAYINRRAAGQAQADSIKEKFRVLFRSWPQHEPVPA